MNAWWKRQAGAAKAFYMLVAALLILALIGWVVAQATGSKPAETSDKQITTQTQEQTPKKGETPFSEPETTPDEEASDENVEVGEYTFTIDDTGLVEMPVTTDPREAAAGAAAVAFTIDFEQWEHEEFLKEAILRMTHPTEEYKGPEGEIHTIWGGGLDTPFWMEYRSPEEAMWMFSEESQAFNDQNPRLHTWMILSKRTVFESLKALPDNQWIGTPVELYSKEEMEEKNPASIRKWLDRVDLTPDTPGATLTEWWGLIEVPQAGAETAQPQTKFPFMMGIWCDAPEDGGICGVAYKFSSKVPQDWPSVGIRE